MKTYEDSYLKRRAQSVIDLQKAGKIVVESYRSDLGLPIRDQLGPLSRASFPHDYAVGTFGWLDYARDNGMYVFTPNPGSDLPPALKDYKILTLTEATIHSANKTVQIKQGDTSITFSSAPVWEQGYNLIKEVNEELSRQNTGILVWRLVWENEDPGKGLFPGPVPKLSNAHAFVPLSGFALDPDDHSLVYFGCTGYKTTNESIRATMLTGKPLNFIQHGESDLLLTPLDKYEQVWEPMPEYTCHHACVIARSALPGKWEPDDEFAYLLVFQGAQDPQAEARHLFIERLVEALDVPILEDWATALWKSAIERKFLTRISTGGDCLGGVKVFLKADWNSLIEELLKAGDIQLTNS